LVICLHDLYFVHLKIPDPESCKLFIFVLKRKIIMSKIHQLSPHEAQKIAAGEVVERPANIVKELIENSLDSGATRINLHIEQAGKSLIRVVDNGCGMDSVDAKLCFNRHATSKIKTVDELETVETFGFRGEALASIASVSKVTLLTKEEHSTEGSCIVIEANNITKESSIGCAVGTDISIADLFSTIPARKKFLKTDQTEWRAIQLLFNAFCFDYPTVHFSLFCDNRLVQTCPSVQTVAERALQLFDMNISQNLIPLQENSNGNYTVSGIISNHEHYRYDRSSIYLFVNKRWVKNISLTSAFIKGYANVIPEGRNPVGIIYVTVPSTEVDINIHPRKEEVKFLHPRRIEQLLQEATKKSLEHHLSAQLKTPVSFAAQNQKTYADSPTSSQPFSFSFNQPQSFGSQTPFAHPQKNNTFKPFDFDAFFTQPTNNSQVTTPFTPQQNTESQISLNTLNPSSQKDNVLQEDCLFKKQYSIIGQYNKTYILIEKEEGLFLVDQHAAHERILYERFAQRFDNPETIELLFPQTVNFSSSDIEILIPHLTLLHKYGVRVEQSGPNSVTIQSAPVHFKNQSLEEVIKEMISWVAEEKAAESQDLQKRINNKLQAQMACKAAVKAGDILTHEQMKQLLSDLAVTENRFACPHGRPTGWLLSLNEIEKKFKRKL
jgi:DNA mismatch repair protein MutL